MRAHRCFDFLADSSACENMIQCFKHAEDLALGSRAGSVRTRFTPLTASGTKE
jgi:hypothetical protein